MDYLFKKKFKKLLKDFLFATYRYKQISKIRDFIIRVDKEYTNRRTNSQVKALKLIANNYNKLDLEVFNGPFKGLKYPFKEAFGSVFTPKIIGTYELELQPIIKEVLNSNYSHIIDIGAAEGYYSVGISKKLPKSKIIAFESESKGRELHNKLAKYNNVENRIKLYRQCTSILLEDVIKNIEKGFIISDCEGCEYEIFNESIIPKLINYDLLIETHSYNGLNTTKPLKNRFKKTHYITPIRVKKRVIKNFSMGYDIKIEDYEKVDCMYEYSAAFNNKIKWLYLKSK